MHPFFIALPLLALAAPVASQVLSGQEIWQFFFHPDTYALEAARFFRGPDSEEGKLIILGSFYTIHSVQIPGRLTWYVLPGETFLAVDEFQIEAADFPVK